MEGLPRGGARHANQPQSMHHDGSFGRYMELKNQKLHEQFREDARNSRQVSTIFHGVTIHVNGVTHPSHQELKHLMAAHGGRFANYYSKDTVTHIVCDNLPDTKLKQMLKSRSALPVVQAAWVVHSISAGKLLPPSHFAIDRLAMAPAQQQLKPFAPRSEITLDKVAIYSQLETPGPPGAIEAAQHSARKSSAAPSPETVPHTPQPHSSHTTPVKPRGTPTQESPDPSPVRLMGPPAPPGRLVPRTPGLPLPPATWTPEQIQAAQRTAQAMRSACDVLKGPPKSSADDPKFLETYFRASRLHFIGTWRMRIEQMVRKELLQSGRIPSTPSAHNPAGTSSQRVVMHVDMDCFFASVAVRNRPELQGIPLAIAHSNHSAGHSEISCVNYIARRCGVRADMWMASARERCPDLVVIPYEFDAYQEVSERMYRILLQHATLVQPMSCDEAYVDVSDCSDPVALAATLRRQIRDATRCNASVGIGPSILLAAMATKKAKPDGVFRVLPQEVDQFLLQQAVSALPGVGWSTQVRLEEMGIETVAQLRLAPRALLQTAFGAKTAQELLRFAHGQDDRPVELPSARKSVGAEVNYGIRFATDDDATAFLRELSKEVAKRLDLCGARGRAVTLKLKRRKADAPLDPPKFLGHGLCDNFSKSVSLGSSVCSSEAVFAAARQLFTALAVPPAEVRGVGISIAKLDGQSHRSAGVSLPSDMHVSSLRSLWGKGPTAAGASGDPQGPSTDAVGLAWPPEPEAAEISSDEALGGDSESDGGGACGDRGAHRGIPVLPVAPSEQGAAAPDVPTAPVEEMLTARPDGGVLREGLAAAPDQNALERKAGDGPLSAIPDFHSLDMSVVDSLPAAMRLELMRAYGLHLTAARPPQRRGSRQPAATPAHGRIRVTPQKRGPVKADMGVAAASVAPRKRVRVAMHGLTMSQVDADVLAELPTDVQAGLREGLPESRGAFRQIQPVDELASRGGPRLIHAVRASDKDCREPAAQDPGALCCGADRSQMNDILRQCESGAVLSLQVQDVHRVCAKLEKLVRSEIVSLKCPACAQKFPNSSAASGDVGGHGAVQARGHGQGTFARLDGVLKLAAAWLSWCIHHKRFLHARQLCTFLLQTLTSRRGCVATSRIRAFVEGVQAVCSRVHGFSLDVPSMSAKHVSD